MYGALKSLNKFKGTQVAQSIFSNQYIIQLEIK